MCVFNVNKTSWTMTTEEIYHCNMGQSMKILTKVKTKMR